MSSGNSRAPCRKRQPCHVLATLMLVFLLHSQDQTQYRGTFFRQVPIKEDLERIAIASAKSHERHLLSTSQHQVSHPPYSQLNTLSIYPISSISEDSSAALTNYTSPKRPCRPPKSTSLIFHRHHCRPPSARTSQARCSRKQRPYQPFRRRFSPNVRRGGGWMRCVSGRCSC